MTSQPDFFQHCDEMPSPLFPQAQFLSPGARRRLHAALASCSTSMLILSNLVFLGGSQVGEIYWDRIFIQGKLLFSDNFLFSTFMQLVSHMGQEAAFLALSAVCDLYKYQPGAKSWVSLWL